MVSARTSVCIVSLRSLNQHRIGRFWNEAVRIVDPLARYAGSLQCWNWSDFREAGGVPAGQLTVWPDRLEMAGRSVFKAVLRPRTIPKERVLLVRPLLPLNPVHQVISAVHPLAWGRQYVNFVVSAPKDQRVGTGNVHYVLGVRSPGAADLLNLLEGAGFPVSRAAMRLTKLSIGPELSWLDFKNRPG